MDFVGLVLGLSFMFVLVCFCVVLCVFSVLWVVLGLIDLAVFRCGCGVFCGFLRGVSLTGCVS